MRSAGTIKRFVALLSVGLLLSVNLNCVTASYSVNSRLMNMDEGAEGLLFPCRPGRQSSRSSAPRTKTPHKRAQTTPQPIHHQTLLFIMNSSVFIRANRFVYKEPGNSDKCVLLHIPAHRALVCTNQQHRIQRN